MQDRSLRCSRRKFLASAAALTLSGVPANAANGANPPTDAIHTRPTLPAVEGRRPIAVLATVYRPLSEAYHLTGRFLHGYQRDGALHIPRHFVRSLYVDQVPDNDLSRTVGKQFDVRVTRSVADALTLGGDKLAVDGVLLIGEHGNYPRNDRHQILYPRFELFEQVVDVFRRTGQQVPVFCDKHLSYSWARAKQMADWSRELGFALMGGSSVPVTWRRPELELPTEAPIEEALVAAHGPIEVFGFHALEALQAMVERRAGGESGVNAVTFLSGKNVWKAGDAGRWSWDLLEAALSRSETVNLGDVRDNAGKITLPGQPPMPPAAFVVEYRDGLRAAALLLNGHVQDFTFAARLRGESKPASCLFHVPPPPGARHFDCLVANIEKLLETGKSPYPIERTLLTTGILEAAMESHHLRDVTIETPLLDVCYAAPADSGFVRTSASL